MVLLDSPWKMLEAQSIVWSLMHRRMIGAIIKKALDAHESVKKAQENTEKEAKGGKAVALNHSRPPMKDKMNLCIAFNQYGINQT